MLVEADNTVEHTRELLTDAVHFFSTYEGNDWKVERVLNELRDHLDLSSLNEKDIFVCDMDILDKMDVPDEYRNYSLGLYSDQTCCRYAGRLVYPVRDVKNEVMGLCGWDPVDQPKYLDSITFGYNAKRGSLYGMEELPTYYKSGKPVFFTEGIVCCNYLRSKGFQAMALLGSTISRYTIEILRRFGYNCILLPDNDHAGLSILKAGKYNLPKARCFVSTVAKDIDDTRKCDNFKYESELLNELSMISNPFHVTKILRMLK